MKNRFLFLTLLLAVATLLSAQAPRYINSQAVLRDASGRLIANQLVAVRITIVQGAPTGTAVYVENHMALTNQNGLYTITIGEGTPSAGSFGAIDWGRGPYFVRSEIDPTGGTIYNIASTQQLLSVPYALYADTAAHYRERQILWRGHDTIYLTGGSFVVVPSMSSSSVSAMVHDSVALLRQSMAGTNSASNYRFDSLRTAAEQNARRQDSTINDLQRRLDSIIAVVRSLGAASSAVGSTGGSTLPRDFSVSTSQAVQPQQNALPNGAGGAAIQHDNNGAARGDNTRKNNALDTAGTERPFGLLNRRLP